VNAANQAVTLVNNIIFTAATTTTTTTVATPTTTVAPPTTTVPAVELQVLSPLETDEEFRTLLPEAGSNVHWLMYVAILLMGMGAVLMTRRKVTN
jgi:LPXTG-motif cell wall-anchored protein